MFRTANRNAPISPEARERVRRQREFIAAGILLLGVAVATWVELSYFGADSWLFLGLFNVNFVLMLVILFLVIRNVVKLVLERRRKVLGSQLRTRLVLSFVLLSLIPTVIMFIASNRVVATSVDYWFKTQVEGSMEAALEVGQSFYAAAADRLRTRSEAILAEVQDRRLLWGGQGMDNVLESKRREYGLTMVGMVTPQQVERNWHAPDAFTPVWREARARIAWDNVAAQRYGSLLWAGEHADYVIGVLAVDGGKAGYLVVAESIGQGLMFKLNRISKGFDEYKNLKNFKNPLKVSFVVILGVLSLVIIFGGMWFGFRIAKGLTAPILALAEGTSRVARGDLGFRIEDKGVDELGILVRSFNAMAADLEQSRAETIAANSLLARSNDEIAARNRYIEAIIDNIAAGVISLDAEGRINTVNKAACVMFATRPDQLAGVHPADLLAPEYAAIIAEMTTDLSARPDIRWQRQVDFAHGERAWKLLVSAVPLPTPGGQLGGIVAVFEDITELERMQRMAAWREVARRIAHEIKNPLTPIKLSAQRLERKYASVVNDPIFVQCTDLIVRQVDHLQQMVQEFSAFAKLPEVTPVPGSLTPLLEEVTGLFRIGHAGITWNINLPDDLPTIPMDGEALHRAFMNILTNAAEVLEGRNDGTVTVTAAHDKELALVRVDVADNGPGLAPEDRSRLFEPYFSRKRGGTGLGLTIVRSIVSDHRGYVRAASPAEGGTVVTIELPVA